MPTHCKVLGSSYTGQMLQFGCFQLLYQHLQLGYRSLDLPAPNPSHLATTYLQSAKARPLWRLLDRSRVSSALFSTKHPWPSFVGLLKSTRLQTPSLPYLQHRIGHASSAPSDSPSYSLKAPPTSPVSPLPRLFPLSAHNANSIPGVGVPLGIMSVFEPLGGILSANLPITYVLFANSFRRMRNHISGPFSGPLRPRGRPSQSSNNRFGRGQDAEDRWIQLDQQASWSTDSKPLAYDSRETEGR